MTYDGLMTDLQALNDRLQTLLVRL